MGYFRVYANLYVVLVAEPGGRKSTSMNIGYKFLEQIKGVPFSADCTTKEAIVTAIKRNEQAFVAPIVEGKVIPPLVYSPLTACIDELSDMLGPSQENMVNFLTTIYAKDFYQAETLKRGVVDILGPYFVLLACTTSQWIALQLRSDVISGGFSRRAVFVYEWKRKRVAFPEITADMQASWEQMLDWGRKLKKLSGVFRWSDDARVWFKDWYDNYEIPKDMILRGYFETKHMQLLKVAMLLHVSRSLDLVLEKQDLLEALAILERTEVNMPRAFEGVGRNELNAVAARCLTLITQNGGVMKEKVIYAEMFSEGTTNEIRTILDHLVSSERLVKHWVDLRGHKVCAYFTPERFDKHVKNLG